MVVRRRKKVRKLRGRSRTMGWGSVGQHRKSGSRGGTGAAGLGKHKWTWTIKYAPDWYGKRGFVRRRMLVGFEKRTINVGEVQDILESMIARGEVAVENGLYVINLSDMGVHKLLGEGKIKFPVKIIVAEASESAIEKIKSAGGEVVLLAQN
ncbi:MAG: uL15 family ribosomal protein [Acidilobaceae archaeon]